MIVSAIAVRDLTVAYNGTPVLDGVDLVVATGEMVAVIGPNGSGKTTLLRAVAGNRQVRSGEARVDGREHGRRSAAGKRPDWWPWCPRTR